MSRKHHAVGRGEFVGSVVFLPLSSDPTERECRFYFGSYPENADCILVKMKVLTWFSSERCRCYTVREMLLPSLLLGSRPENAGCYLVW